MTDFLREKLGQMLMCGWTGASETERLTYGESARRLIEELRPGAVILMRDNVDSPNQVKELTSVLQNAAKSMGMPLLIATDQEGGRVARLKPPQFRETVTAQSIGESGDPQRAFDEAKAIGEELAAHGINWNLAPVLDVNSNPQSPIIGNRAYSGDPHIAARFGVEAVKGLQDGARIASCGKHFPGHGDVAVDSHIAMPVADKTYAQLLELELVPFQRAIEAGIDSIMTAHIMLPKIDPVFPATLSKTILTDILRNDMKFDRVIATDCFRMHAISDNFEPGDAAALAVNAGVDIITCVGDFDRQKAIIDGLVLAVKQGKIDEYRIDQSVARIANLKQRVNKPSGILGAA